jgi:hypothetical protein
MGKRRADDDMPELLNDPDSDTDDDDMPGLIDASDADDADTESLLLLYDELAYVHLSNSAVYTCTTGIAASVIALGPPRWVTVTSSPAPDPTTTSNVTDNGPVSSIAPITPLEYQCRGSAHIHSLLWSPILIRE